MTNLDLPQISLARYVDLLKRRKWQVVPISLLGMGIGALVAAAVPRYYVASTEVRFNAERMLDDSMRQLSDPLESLLADVYTLIPVQVPIVLRELGWQEAAVEDPDDRAAFIDEVTKRITIQDAGSGQRRGRSNTTLKISYRDTDGQRAADFTNALREAWIKDQLDRIERDWNDKRRRVQERKNALDEEVRVLRRDLAEFEALHELDAMTADNWSALERSVYVQLNDRRRELLALERARDALDIQIDALEQRLEGGYVPRTIPAPPEPIDPLQAQRFNALGAEILRLEFLSGIYRPGPQRDEYERRLAKAQAEMDKLRPVGKVREIANPLYLEQERQLDDLRTQRTVHDNGLDSARAEIAALQARIEELPRLNYEYRRRLEATNAAQATLNAAEASLDAVTTQAQLVQSSRPYETLSEARTPRRPTEPSISLLALMGSIIGLGVAVGLILAFDALRFTYKTIDDLERGLPVPVLGGVSHVETMDERVQVRRGRLLVSILAVTLLFLVVAVATIYYVWPARLPTWARDVLDMVLGGVE